MGLDHARRIERLGLLRGEYRAPDREEQDRRDDEPSDRFAVLRTELAAGDATPMQLRKQRQSTVDNRGLLESG